MPARASVRNSRRRKREAGLERWLRQRPSLALSGTLVLVCCGGRLRYMASQFQQKCDRVFRRFVTLLRRRFEQGAATTEDAIRYTFFAALVDCGLRPEQIIVEAPHPTLKRARMDTLLPSFAGQTVALEFKYHRVLEGTWNRPKSAQAGSVFEDVRRLLLVPSTEARRRFLVYVTDQDMIKYMLNPKNGLKEFFELQPLKAMVVSDDFVTSKCGTFQKRVLGELYAKLRCLYMAELSNIHALRIYEVRER